MKMFYPLAVLFFVFFTTACTTVTNFTEYRGQGVIEGKGGTVRSVDGIDFWENGEPDRKYRILGVIDDSRGEGLIARSGQDGNIAQVAKENGGDAVILSSSNREFRGMNFNSGAANFKRLTKLMVVKYVQ